MQDTANILKLLVVDLVTLWSLADALLPGRAQSYFFSFTAQPHGVIMQVRSVSGQSIRSFGRYGFTSTSICT